MHVPRPIRVCIIGAGFGGVSTYVELHRRLHGTGTLEVTLIGEHDSFVFIPMIHEVAPGGLAPESVIQPVRTLPQCCVRRFVEGRATLIDADRKIVFAEQNRLAATDDDHLSPARDFVEVPYDVLVLATGSETNYYDVLGAREHASDLKSLRDAADIRNRIIESFQDAEREDDPARQRDILRFVIVGGGPTGVELAGELSDLIAGELTEAFPHLKNIATVFVIERGGVLLKDGIDPWFAERAEKILHAKLGVYVLYNTSVSEVTDYGVKTDHGFIPAETVIWAAGVKARALTTRAVKQIEREARTGRIKVNEFLQVPSYPDVFVVGDQAWAADAEDGQAYPMRAVFAVAQGRHTGRNIARRIAGRPLVRFYYADKGFIMSLGKHGALARVFGVKLSGFPAWFVYRLAYIDKAVGWRAKLHLLIEWTLNVFVPRDISKL